MDYDPIVDDILNDLEEARWKRESDGELPLGHGHRDSSLPTDEDYYDYGSYKKDHRDCRHAV